MTFLAWLKRMASRHVPETDTGGEQALEQAKRIASEVVGRWPEVRKTRRGIEATISHNNLSEAVRKALGNQ